MNKIAKIIDILLGERLSEKKFIMQEKNKGTKKYKKVGLALGSGGWRGLAHTGVIKALLRNNIDFEIIAGSSTGSIMGGYFAAVQDIEKLEFILKNIRFQDLLKVFSDFRPAQGLFKGNQFKKVITDVVGDINIEDLPLKFAATAVDFMSGELVFIKEGPLGKAIRASASIPLVFQPVSIDGKKLIDGATRMPVPVFLARELGAEVVIAVNLYKNVFPVEAEKYGSFQTALKSSHLLLRELARRDCKTADITLYPDIPEGKNYSIFSRFIGNAENIIGYGEKVVEENIEEIRKVLR